MIPYLFCYSENMGPHQTILDFLDTLPVILNWYTLGSQGVIIISERTPAELRILIHTKYPSGFFIISEMKPHLVDGWLPEEAWGFVNNPKSSGRWK